MDRVARMAPDHALAFAAVADAGTRLLLMERLEEMAYSIATLAHQSARVSKTASVSEGCLIGADAVIGAGAFLGRGCHVSAGAIVGRNAVVGDGCFLGMGAIAGESAFLASGSAVEDGGIVGAWNCAGGRTRGMWKVGGGGAAGRDADWERWYRAEHGEGPSFF